MMATCGRRDMPRTFFYQKTGKLPTNSIDQKRKCDIITMIAHSYSSAAIIITLKVRPLFRDEAGALSRGKRKNRRIHPVLGDANSRNTMCLPERGRIGDRIEEMIMTEKELHKLHRQDLLQLLVEQSREARQLGSQLAETEDNLNQMQSGNDRLKTKLDEKDEQIDRLKERLDEKDAQINKLKSRLDEKDATIHSLNADVKTLQAKRQLEIDEIIKALKLGSLLELIQQASDQYMLNLRRNQETIVDGERPYAIGAAEEVPETAEMEPEPEPWSAALPVEEDPADPAEEEIPEAPQEEAPSEDTVEIPAVADTEVEEGAADAPSEEDSGEILEEISEEVPETEASDEPAAAEHVSEEQPGEDQKEEDTAQTKERLAEGTAGFGDPVFVKRPHFWQRWRRHRY